MNSVTSQLYMNILINNFLETCPIKENAWIDTKNCTLTLQRYPTVSFDLEETEYIYRKFFYKINIVEKNSTVVFTLYDGTKIARDWL